VIGHGRSTRDPNFGPPTNPRRLNFYGHFRRSRRQQRLRAVALAAASGDTAARAFVLGARRLFRRLFRPAVGA
jgi:hypothetical protein